MASTDKMDLSDYEDSLKKSNTNNRIVIKINCIHICYVFIFQYK